MDKVSSVIAKESNGNIQITFTIPFILIKKAQEDAIAEMAKDVEIPGFRKGKAPLTKVADKIPQNRLIEHSLGHLLPTALSDAVKKENLKLAVYPKFELVSAKEGEAWQIRGITCELPIVNLGNYKKIIPKIPNKEEKENAVVKILIENIKIDIPQILIEEEANNRLSNLLSRLEKLGLALESYLVSINKKSEDLRADYAHQAKDAIILDLILSKIAEEQNIKVEEKEIDGALKVSDSKDISSDKKRLIESILKRRKALDFLISLS